MAESAPFVLSRATPEDMEHLVEVEYECFPPFVLETFMGCSNRSDCSRLARHYRNRMEKDTSEIWIKVVDKVTKQIVAGSLWNVFPGLASPAGDDDNNSDLPPWLEGKVRDETMGMLQQMSKKRRAANPGGYVHLHICFTSPQYQRQGAGALMLEWGCEVADTLFLPAWVEASAEGTLLYKKFGFSEYEKIEIGALAGGVNLRREPVVTSFKGGKAAVMV